LDRFTDAEVLFHDQFGPFERIFALLHRQILIPGPTEGFLPAWAEGLYSFRLEAPLSDHALKSRESVEPDTSIAAQRTPIIGVLRAKPGKVSLAHRGVLFLDELPEFARATLETLRQPVESGRAVVSRVNAHVTYPARFQLVAAMNPCRCGHLDDAALGCGRAPKCAQEYQAKISGPLFDRIDMHVDVPAVNSSDLALPAPREGSKQVAARVAAARERQAARYAGKGIASNAEVDGQLLDEVATPEPDGRKLLAEAAERF
jgi:predicted ATPase with chaperone activity